MGINQNSVFYHSTRLAASSVLLQLCGFFYRILLGRLAGAQVIAVHGLVMSAYNVVLAVTLTGIAFSVSRIAARYEALGSGGSVKRLISLSLGLFLGLFGSLALPFAYFHREFAALILGDADAAPALFLLIPCLFLTGFENVHKAYFYGSGQTVPPMISEILEMLCRIVAALLLFRAFPDLNIPSAAALIIVGMVASEIISSTFLTLCYRFQLPHLKGRDDIPRRQILNDIADMALPVSLSTLISRMLSAANTILIPRTLVISGMSTEEAMEQFGLLFGMTMPLLMLPSAVLNPLITILTPRFTAAHARGQSQEIRRKCAKGLHVVGLFAVPALCIIVGFGDFLAELLYRQPAAASYLLPLAFNTFLGFCYIVCESVLEGIGQQKRSAVLAVVATASGVLLTLIFGGIFRLGMVGFLIGELSSSAFGVIISLLWVKRYTGLQFRFWNWLGIPLLSSLTSLLCVRPLFIHLCHHRVIPLLAFAFCVLLMILLYSLLLRLLGIDYPKYLKNLLNT